jgi:hypothetical protein
VAAMGWRIPKIRNLFLPLLGIAKRSEK